MSSQATASSTPESVANLEFYRTRDEFVRAYKPVNDEERLLVFQIARASVHLQEVYEFRSQVTAEKGLLGLFNEDFDKYKLLMRNLSEAERMWRYAVQEFQRARRRRDDLGSMRRSNVSTVASNRPPQSASSGPHLVPSADNEEPAPETSLASARSADSVELRL